MGCDPVEFRHLERCGRERVGSAEHDLELLPQRQRPVEHMQLVLAACDPSSGRRVLHSISGEEIRPTMKVDAGADGGHDQDRRHRAGNAVPLQKAGGRRQHGADHERRHDGQEESLGGIEHGDNADDQQRHQRKSHDFGAADDRRQFGFAVGQRRTAGRLGQGRTRIWLSPALRRT